MIQTLQGQDGTHEKKDDDDPKTKNIRGELTVTKSYTQLYDIFLLCYSGYCAFMFYACYTILAYPEHLLPIFGSIMFAVILAKVVLTDRWEKRDRGGGNVDLRNSKKASLLFFNVPMYGGYVLVFVWERLQQQS